MAYQVTPAVSSCDCLRRAGRSGIAIYIGLLILLAPTTTAYALWNVLLVAPLARQSVNTSVATTQRGTDVRTLEPGKPIERELTGGEVHSYRLMLTAGQFCQQRVDQRGIDVVVALYGLDGEKIAEIDSPNYMNGPELISLLVSASGN